jgi:hypothetical protein
VIELKDLIIKVSGIPPQLESPYQRFKAIDPKAIESALRDVSSLGKGYKPSLAKSLQILFLLSYSREVESISANMAQSDKSPMSDEEIAGQADRMWAENYAPKMGDLKALVSLMGKHVGNADRYPEAEWLDVVKPIGSVGGSTLFLVGWAVPNSNEYPLVAVDRGGSLWATPLWELQGHSQDTITIQDGALT